MKQVFKSVEDIRDAFESFELKGSEGECMTSHKLSAFSLITLHNRTESNKTLASRIPDKCWMINCKIIKIGYSEAGLR